MAPISPAVKRAIHAALEDINLLQPLVAANSPRAANATLKAYNPKLTLQGKDVKAFYDLLKNGTVKINARQLVAYYYGLQPPKPMALRIRPEWILGPMKVK